MYATVCNGILSALGGGVTSIAIFGAVSGAGIQETAAAGESASVRTVTSARGEHVVDVLPHTGPGVGPDSTNAEVGSGASAQIPGRSEGGVTWEQMSVRGGVYLRAGGQAYLLTVGGTFCQRSSRASH